MSAEPSQHDRQPSNDCLHFSCSVSDTPQTDSIVRFLKERTRYDLTDHEVWRNFGARLEALLNTSKQALEAADECLALIEDVGHGAMSDNVTVARGIVLAALSQNK